jgi:hypothetical protein
VLDRLEIELGSEGGTSNGQLKCTYEHFEEYGIDRQAIAPAIREVEALGFVEITERGRGGNREYRIPSTYRLTYRHTDAADPTNEWKRFHNDKEVQGAIKSAIEIAAKARAAKNSRVENPPLNQVGKSTPKTTKAQGWKSTLRAHHGNPPYLYISGREAKPARTRHSAIAKRGPQAASPSRRHHPSSRKSPLPQKIWRAVALQNRAAAAPRHHRDGVKMMSDTITLNAAQVAALRTLLRYTHDDEEKHFDECEHNGQPTDGHIFHAIRRLVEAID